MTIKVLDTGISIVGNQEAFSAAGGPEGHAVLIEDLDQSQLADTQSSNVTYDLRVGSEYRVLSHSKKRQLAANASFTLHGGQSAIIETEEFVHLPGHAFGLVVSKVQMTQQGLSNISTKVDPGYVGRLIITVSNISRRRIVFQRGQAFCSIVFLTVEKRARLYSKSSKAIVSVTGLSRLGRILERLEGRPTTVNSWLILSNVVLAGVTIWAVLSG